MPKVSEAFGLYACMLLAFGIIFQMPTLVLALARMGVVTAGFLWRHTKYAILIIFIISAVITPSSDVVNQSLMAVPDVGPVPVQHRHRLGSLAEEIASIRRLTSDQPHLTSLV